MFGKKKFSAFPEFKSEKERVKFKLSAQAKLVILSVVVLFPAAWFWSSVVLRLGLGTDYFFDVYFDNLAESIVGNLVLIAAVVFLPGAAIGLNGIGYIQRKDKLALSTLVIAGIFLAAGFFAVINRGV